MCGMSNSAKSGRGGFTLIEMMVAMGIFAIVMAAFLQVLMSTRRANTAIAASMTANAAIRAQADESMAIAADNAGGFDGNFARAFISHFGGIPSGDALPIGPNGTDVPRIERPSSDLLIYRFPVPEPGSFSRYIADTPWSGTADKGDLIYYTSGIGEMRIYLNESKIPPQDTDGVLGNETLLTNALNQPVVWENDGDRPGDPDDGLLANTPENIFTGGAGELDNPPAGLKRVFADIIVTYYTDATHTRTLSLNERRILVIGTLAMKDLFS